MSVPPPDGAALDALYAELIRLHAGRDTDDAFALTARLVLLLMAEVGDVERIRACLAAVAAEPPGPGPRTRSDP
jgi:hypothetical protein